MADVLDKLYEIKPRSIVYLFSGGKDSSVALALTRDAVSKYAVENRVKVYILYIVIPGNTHPLNSFCAAKVMYWHRKHYGFEPVFMARNKLFQEYMAKYGLQKGPQRWCYLEFKEKVLREFHRRLPRPILYIDGMKPSDSRHRSEIITGEFQLINSKGRGSYWSWHPLFNIGDDDELFNTLRKYDEFNCVLRLYEEFGDSLNCVVCPYKSRAKNIKYHYSDSGALNIIYDFMTETMRSKYHLRNHRPSDGNILEVIYTG